MNEQTTQQLVRREDALTFPAKLRGHLSSEGVEVGMKQSLRPQAGLWVRAKYLAEEIHSQVRCSTTAAHPLQQETVLPIGQRLCLHCERHKLWQPCQVIPCHYTTWTCTGTTFIRLKHMQDPVVTSGA